MANQITEKIQLDRAVGACKLCHVTWSNAALKKSRVYGGVQRCSPYKSLCDSRKLSPETPWQSRDPITTRWGRILPRKLSPICPEMTHEEASRVASKTSGL